MVYDKQTWVNGIAGGTPVNASRLQHIEDGLLATSLVADAAETPAETAAAIAAQHTTDNATYLAPTVLAAAHGVAATNADNTAAMQAAIAATGGKGLLVLPAGVIKCASTLDFTSASSLTVVGYGTMTGGAGYSILRFNGTTATGINLTGALGVLFDGVQVDATGGTVTTLVDLTSAQQVTFRQGFLGVGAGTLTQAALLKNSTQIDFDHISFSGGTYAVKRDVTGYANIVTFRCCQFSGQGTRAVLDPHQQWRFDSCNFEPSGGAGVGVPTGLGFSATTVSAQGVSFDNCTFADVPGAYAGGIAWIDYSSANAVDLSVLRCNFSVGSAGPVLRMGFYGAVSGLRIDQCQVVGPGGATAVAWSIGGTVSGVDIGRCIYSGLAVSPIDLAVAPNGGRVVWSDGTQRIYEDTTGGGTGASWFAGSTEVARIDSAGNIDALAGNLNAFNKLNPPNGAGTTLGVGLFQGSGAPGFTAAAGAIYFRSDTPTVANQRIYINTTGAAVWVGIA